MSMSNSLLWLFGIIGLVFGSLGALAAFLITYGEYEKHKLPRSSLLSEAFKSAIFAFVFFVLLLFLVFFSVNFHFGVRP